MPELPEVETVRQGLRQIIQPPKRIESLRFSAKRLRFKYPKDFQIFLAGFQVLEIRRRSKYLIFEGQTHVILNHLGMTGHWRQDASFDEDAHDHLGLKFEGGLSLIYNDVRRFGFFDFVEKSKLNECRWFQHLGPEPLPKDQLQTKHVIDRLKVRQAPIKNAIMDARLIVGVGNIYASEALHRAGIHPLRASSRVSEQRLAVLIEAIQSVLTEAIANGGSTIKDFKTSGGSTGYFQTRLRVYGKKGEPCPTCGSAIRSERLAGRSTFWCPKCQT